MIISFFFFSSRGASKNIGLGNKFLSHIKQVDSILHCVRCFEDVVVTHVEGGKKKKNN